MSSPSFKRLVDLPKGSLILCHLEERLKQRSIGYQLRNYTDHESGDKFDRVLVIETLHAIANEILLRLMAELATHSAPASEPKPDHPQASGSTVIH